MVKSIMLKQILFLPLFFVINITFVIGQKKTSNDDMNSLVIGLSSGFSAVGFVFDGEKKFDSLNYNCQSRMPLHLNIDEFISNRTTYGGQFSWQTFNVKINHWEYKNSNGFLAELNNETAQMHRFYLGFKSSRHFVNNHYIDFYGGGRIGFIWWRTNLRGKSVDFKNQLKSEFFSFNKRPDIGVYTGLRIKLSPGAGCNLEINLGSPYLFSFGFNKFIKN